MVSAIVDDIDIRCLASLALTLDYGHKVVTLVPLIKLVTLTCLEFTTQILVVGIHSHNTSSF